MNKGKMEAKELKKTTPDKSNNTTRGNRSKDTETGSKRKEL